MSKATPTSLAELSMLAAAQVAAEKEVEKAQATLKEKNAVLLRLREESVPMAMAELEMTKVKLSTGEEVTVKRDVYCSITEDNRDTAHNWLEHHDFGGIIRTIVAVEFGKDEMPFALALIKLLSKMKVKAKVLAPVPPKKVKVKGKLQMVKQPDKLQAVEKKLEPTLARSVHPQTLKAFLREQLSKAGEEELPLEVFGARPVWVSKINPPKQPTQ